MNKFYVAYQIHISITEQCSPNTKQLIPDNLGQSDEL